MNILTIYAHPSRQSFCHAVLKQFCKWLADAGHRNEAIASRQGYHPGPSNGLR